MQNFEGEFLKAKNLLASARKIIIISHKNPDGDAVGANLAMKLALKYQWQKEVVSVCTDKPTSSHDFLPEINEFQQDFDVACADALIAVDCGASYMTNFHKTKSEIFSGNPPLINIDHHASNDMFGKINIVDSRAASTTLILFYFLKYCGFEINRKIATCLLNGLYYDTGSFMHSNTSPEALRVASDLVWRGADFKTIARRQFGTIPVPQLKLYGKIFERARVNSKKLTVSAVTDADFSAAGAAPEDTSGAIDLLNSVSDGDFSCLLHEDKNNMIKGSFRSRVDSIDLAKLASLFGGGGHKKAAGFSFPSRLLQPGNPVKITRV